MRFWVRLGLIAWLLTGLLSAPAMAFGMTCHGGTNNADGMAMAHDVTHYMSGDMTMTMPMPHKSMPQNDAGLKPGKDMQHKAFACAVHCLSAGAGFIFPSLDDTKPVIAAAIRGFYHLAPLMGLIVGPPLEPPISALV